MNTRLFLAVCLALAAALLYACGGGDDRLAPSVTPRPTRLPSPSPTPPPPQTAYRLIYRERGATEDTFWRVNPADPGQREQIAAFPHQEGKTTVASLSPDARMLAVLVLPEGVTREDASQADAHVIDLKTGKTTRLTGGIDYQFRPLWSPDSRLLWMRRYTGFDILSSDVTIVWMRVERELLPGESTPTPTPRPTPSPTPLPPDQTPSPTPAPEDPVHVVLQAKYSQVQAFIPLGFAADNRTMYFVQVEGGTRGTTLVGSLAPATAASIEEERQKWQMQVKAFLEANPTPGPDATPLPPDAPPPPTLPPSPTPQTRLIVQLTEQTAEDYALSPDGDKVAFRATTLVEGNFVTRIHKADLITGEVGPLPSDQAPAGDQIGAAWHPDSARVAVGIVPGGGRGIVALIALGGGIPEFMPTPAEGFDIPRTWAPDGSWLAVVNHSGKTLANPGMAKLELISPAGHRFTISSGAGVEQPAAVIGWEKVQ